MPQLTIQCTADQLAEWHASAKAAGYDSTSEYFRALYVASRPDTLSHEVVLRALELVLSSLDAALGELGATRDLAHQIVHGDYLESVVHDD